MNEIFVIVAVALIVAIGLAMKVWESGLPCLPDTDEEEATYEIDGIEYSI